MTERTSDPDALSRLAATIAGRRAGGSPDSYTVKLIEKGVAGCARKLGEEAVETVIAAMEGDRDAVVSESADLLYHLLVLLEAGGVTLEEVLSELARREGAGGLTEKAAREQV